MVDFIKVERTAQNVKSTQIWEKMQQVGRKVQIHDAELGKKMDAERKFHS